jgi:hypothetical protein
VAEDAPPPPSLIRPEVRVRRKLIWEFDERLAVTGAAGSPDNTGSI